MTQQMPQSRPPAAPDIQVKDITQLETYKRDSSGRPVQGFDIEFTTPSGTRASVFVPSTRYNPENVKAEIMAKAAQVEAVHQIAT